MGDDYPRRIGPATKIRKLQKDVAPIDKEKEASIKFATSIAFPSVVGILSRHLPDDMAQYTTVWGKFIQFSKCEIKSRGELVFWGSGIIYESYFEAEADDFTSIIICAANLFVRTDGLQPPDIQVNVYLSDGQICQGRVIACDFHYNLAAIRIQTPCQLPTATLRDLDDVFPLNVTRLQQQLNQQHPPRLRPHSTKFNISPKTPLITIARSFTPRNAHVVGSGLFSPTTFTEDLDYSELYCVKKNTHPEKKGGAVINYLGEVIGLMFYNSSFLPMNLVSTWWKNFKTCRQYHRPCLGVKIANLHSSHSKYLTVFLAAFPEVTGGAIVTEVAEDSPAYTSGIRPDDVIIKCDGKLVRSSLELFEMVWNKVGIECVELDVLRWTNGENMKLSLKVEQTSPDKLYQWEQTPWSVLGTTEPEYTAE